MIDEKKLTDFINSKEFQTRIVNSYRTVQDLLLEYIDRLPKIGEWILCSERLPEEDTDVLIYIPHDGVDMAYISDENWRYTRGDEFIGTVENLNVIAWQPLPAPYEVKSDE